MRLWHKDLIPVLPRNQLIGQWRECCAIAKAVAENGTPNHVLVNKVMYYPAYEFVLYAHAVCAEMQMRKFKCDFCKFMTYYDTRNMFLATQVPWSGLFCGWHNDRYLHQCLHNLQEKYDCGAIPDEEWNLIIKKYPSVA